MQSVQPTPPNRHYYLCTQAGTSAATAPSWPTNGGTVTDGTVVWQNYPDYYLDIPTLPTLRECSSPGWTAGAMGAPATANGLMFGALSGGAVLDRPVDLWSNDTTKRLADNAMTAAIGVADGPRIADDVILNNVIGFQVLAWNPNMGSYVDGNPSPSIAYDTWSTSYDSPNGSNGFDDNNDGIVDDDAEKNNTPPCTYPLRGIQVKIRIFEPDSRQVREVTVVQDFLPQ